MRRRVWTPRDPEPTDAYGVVDNQGGVFVRTDEGLWIYTDDTDQEWVWPLMWDGYGGDWDLIISELFEDEIADVAPDCAMTPEVPC